MYRKFFEKLSNNKIICKICSTRMGRGNMVRHFKLKHQFVNRETEKKDNSRFDTRKKPSPWAKYCIEVGENQFQCVMCNNVLNMPKAHGNLKRHIKFKHPKVFERETKESLKSFWKQFGINSEAEAQKIIKESEEDIEVEEVAIGEAEYLEEYMVDETATVVQSDPENEKNTEEEEPMEGESGEKISKKKYNTNTEESLIVSEVHAIDTIVDFGNLEFVSEDDAKFEEKIKWLADRAIPGKKSFKTRIWNFFKEIKKNRIYQCKLCKRKLAGSSRSSSNLKRHLLLVHEKAYEIITNSPNFHKIPKGTIDKLQKYIIKPTDKTFETSYFEDQGDNQYKCKVCDEVIHSDASDSVLLFKHINEEHSEEVVGGIEEPDGDDQEEGSVLFVKKKDLQIS